MSIFTYFIIGAALAGLWFLAGKMEWQVPTGLARRIERLRVKGTHGDKLAAADFISVLAADRSSLKEIEKEVYLLKKKKITGGKQVVMYIYLKSKEDLDQAELTKVKSCLERRFPDLTVNFITDQEVKGSCIFI